MSIDKLLFEHILPIVIIELFIVLQVVIILIFLNII